MMEQTTTAIEVRNNSSMMTPVASSRQSNELIAASEREKSHIQSCFAIAKQMPRDINQFRLNLLKNCERPKFAELVEYSKPIGGKPIKGLSVRIADTALQLYGNIECDTRIVYDDDRTRSMKIYVTDYETNVTKSKDIQIRKEVERKSNKGREVISSRINSYGEEVYLVVATEDEVQTKQEAMVAKARRDLILSLIPRDILDEAREVAAETLSKQDAVDPDATKKKLMSAFANIGVLPKSIAEYLGHQVDVLSPSEISDLRRIYSAISSGEAKWADFIDKGSASEEDDDLGKKTAKPKSPFETKKSTGDKSAIVEPQYVGVGDK